MWRFERISVRAHCEHNSWRDHRTFRTCGSHAHCVHAIPHSNTHIWRTHQLNVKRAHDAKQCDDLKLASACYRSAGFKRSVPTHHRRPYEPFELHLWCAREPDACTFARLLLAPILWGAWCVCVCARNAQRS